MSNRILTVRKSFLGRIYGPDVEMAIKRLSDRLDALMSSSMNLAMAADFDLSGQISEVNTRLVNDVILPSDQISDENAQARISEIENEVQNLENSFYENNVEIGRGAGMITANVLPATQARDLLDQVKKAFDLYTSTVDRYAGVKEYVASASALPATGQKLSEMLRSFEFKLRGVDLRVAPMHQYAENLERAISEAPGNTVAIDRDAVPRMQEWAASVFQADEVLKRIEAIALRKPVEVTPSAKAPRGTPWALIGIAGIVLVGLAFWAATD